jgi:kynurenine 3-monooxygenase
MPRGSQVTIVGGGLVGSLLAILLARRGERVTVYERRSDMRAGPVEAGRSINLVLTRRGIRGLERVGLAERALELTVPVYGRMVHGGSGAPVFQPYGRDESECNHSISRAALNEFLIREAAACGVRFRFDARLLEADLPSGRLVFEDPRDGTRHEVRADVVFGTDGAGSAVRTALTRLPGFDERIEPLGHGYKELDIPAAPDGAFRIEKNALHVWPRGAFMLMALPNPGGDFTVTLYLPESGPLGFDRLTSPEHVTALFREHFADAVPLIPDLEAAFLARPTGALGTVRCRPWHLDGRALVLGDAAHAIVPFFGQGMNCGFEDCTVLDDLLGESRGDWSAMFAELERLRKPNADAIADMAVENFVEMRDRIGDARFLLRKAVEHRLEVEFPLEYRSRYSMVMYSHIPYRTAQEAGEVEQSILDELCRDLRSADELDIDRARRLVHERLTPLLRDRGVSLEY